MRKRLNLIQTQIKTITIGKIIHKLKNNKWLTPEEQDMWQSVSNQTLTYSAINFERDLNIEPWVYIVRHYRHEGKRHISFNDLWKFAKQSKCFYYAGHNEYRELWLTPQEFTLYNLAFSDHKYFYNKDIITRWNDEESFDDEDLDYVIQEKHSLEHNLKHRNYGELK